MLEGKKLQKLHETGGEKWISPKLAEAKAIRDCILSKLK